MWQGYCATDCVYCPYPTIKPYLAGNDQKQESAVQNPDEIALDDDDEDEDEDDDEDEEEAREEEEEEEEREVIKQCVPDEVFGKLAAKAYPDEEDALEWWSHSTAMIKSHKMW